MRRLRISYTTRYQYREPVSFGPHRAMMRPREGHDVRILGGKTEVSPDAEVQWLRDIYGNAVAALTFPTPARELRVHGEIDLLMIKTTSWHPPNTSRWRRPRSGKRLAALRHLERACRCV